MTISCEAVPVRDISYVQLVEKIYYLTWKVSVHLNSRIETQARRIICAQALA